MPKFLICFRVEQLLQGSIEVEADSREAAAAAFDRGDYDQQRLDAKLDLDDSEDSIAEIHEIKIVPPAEAGGLHPTVGDAILAQHGAQPNLSSARLSETAAIPDSAIDTSDILEAGQDFFAKARLASPTPRVHVLTIQWRSWDRTVEAFATHEAARARLDAIIREHYPDDDGDADAFCDHGHSWWIDELSIEGGVS